MEMKLGTKVITLISKNVVERDNVNIFLPQGLTGYVCDVEYIDDGFVMVQFFEKEVTEKGTGVYTYKINEIKVDA